MSRRGRRREETYSLAELAQMFGVSRERILLWERFETDDFPECIESASGRPRWFVDEINEWAVANDYELGDDEDDDELEEDDED